MRPYQRPILSRIFDLLGALLLIFAGLVIVWAFRNKDHASIFIGAGGIVAAIIYFGIAQVIDFLGRTAHYTERLVADQHELAAALRTQTEVLTLLVEEVKRSERPVMHLKNLEQLGQHTNSLLEWMGGTQRTPSEIE